eukprot:768240-Hanusia_phi.AAC.5
MGDQEQDKLNQESLGEGKDLSQGSRSIQRPLTMFETLKQRCRLAPSVHHHAHTSNFLIVLAQLHSPWDIIGEDDEQGVLVELFNRLL